MQRKQHFGGRLVRAEVGQLLWLRGARLGAPVGRARPDSGLRRSCCLRCWPHRRAPRLRRRPPILIRVQRHPLRAERRHLIPIPRERSDDVAEPGSHTRAGASAGRFLESVVDARLELADDARAAGNNDAADQADHRREEARTGLEADPLDPAGRVWRDSRSPPRGPGLDRARRRSCDRRGRREH